MTWANRTTFFLISFTTIFVTVAYGGVHQPILVLFYLLVAAMTILVAIDALQVGAWRIDQSRLQVPIYAVATYGLIQIIPFGRLAELAGVVSIPRTISADPFSTEV